MPDFYSEGYEDGYHSRPSRAAVFSGEAREEYESGYASGSYNADESAYHKATYPADPPPLKPLYKALEAVSARSDLNAAERAVVGRIAALLTEFEDSEE